MKTFQVHRSSATAALLAAAISLSTGVARAAADDLQEPAANAPVETIGPAAKDGSRQFHIYVEAECRDSGRCEVNFGQKAGKIREFEWISCQFETSLGQFIHGEIRVDRRFPIGFVPPVSSFVGGGREFAIAEFKNSFTVLAGQTVRLYVDFTGRRTFARCGAGGTIR